MPMPCDWCIMQHKLWSVVRVSHPLLDLTIYFNGVLVHNLLMDKGIAFSWHSIKLQVKAALRVDHPTNKALNMLWLYLCTLGFLVVLKLTARKIGGRYWLHIAWINLQGLQASTSSTASSSNRLKTPQGYNPNWPENTIRKCCQNISNESQSNTSKWDMGCMNYCALPLPLVLYSFWFHAHCCAIIVRREKLKIKWAKTFPEILDMSPEAYLYLMPTPKPWYEIQNPLCGSPKLSGAFFPISKMHLEQKHPEIKITRFNLNLLTLNCLGSTLV